MDRGWFGGDGHCCTGCCVHTCIRDDYWGQWIGGGVDSPCSPVVEASTRRFNSSSATSSWDTLSLSAAVSEGSVTPRSVARVVGGAGDSTVRVDVVAAH